MLLAAKDRVRLHMPGHKGRLDPFDTTELPVTDDLYAPESGIRRAEEMAARAFGAAHTLMLTGGSTAGILAMLLAYVSPGEQVILPRNAHHSALSACVWGGLDAVFADELSQAVARHPQARAVFVTRPDYYGRCMDLAPLCAQAHAAGMRVLVDEAHGAHFAWWDQPQSAGRLGADAWVQSAHKTLPALNGDITQGEGYALARMLMLNRCLGKHGGIPEHALRALWPAFAACDPALNHRQRMAAAARASKALTGIAACIEPKSRRRLLSGAGDMAACAARLLARAAAQCAKR